MRTRDIPAGPTYRDCMLRQWNIVLNTLYPSVIDGVAQENVPPPERTVVAVYQDYDRTDGEPYSDPDLNAHNFACRYNVMDSGSGVIRFASAQEIESIPWVHTENEFSVMARNNIAQSLEREIQQDIRQRELNRQACLIRRI